MVETVIRLTCVAALPNFHFTSSGGAGCVSFARPGHKSLVRWLWKPEQTLADIIRPLLQIAADRRVGGPNAWPSCFMNVLMVFLRGRIRRMWLLHLNDESPSGLFAPLRAVPVAQRMRARDSSVR